MSPSRRSAVKLAALWLVAVLVAPAGAAGPRDEALRLVPDDVGFCLVVQDLRDHARAFLASPFVEHFRSSALDRAFARGPEIRKLREAEDQLKANLDVDWPRLRDDILGDAVVFAFRPSASGKAEEDEGVMLVRARDEALLARLVERLNRLQEKSGDVKSVETRRHRSAEYVRRVEKGNVQFYYLHGPVLAVSSQENFLKRVIERDLGESGTREPSVAGRLRRLGADGALAALWVNPRAFDAALARKAAAAGAEEAAVVGRFLAYWKALDGVVLSGLVGKEDLVLDLAVQVRAGQLPAAARRAFGVESPSPALWEHFPAGALLAMAGRLDTAATVDLLGEFLTEEARRRFVEAADRGAGAALGKDVGKDILPFLGPDWGLCVTAPDAADKGWFPHVVWAIRVRPGGSGAGLDRGLVEALNLVAMLFVLGYNQDHPHPMSLRSTTQDQAEVRYLTQEDFPPGLQPAFGLKGGYLVLASSPEAIRRFRPDGPGESSRAAGDETPVLRLSLRDLAAYLKGRREALAAWAAAHHAIGPEEAARRLGNLASALELFDRLDVGRRASAGRFDFVCRLRTAQALRK